MDKFSEIIEYKDTAAEKDRIARIAADIDVSRSMLLRSAVRFGLAIIEKHPALIKIIDVEAIESITHR